MDLGALDVLGSLGKEGRFRRDPRGEWDDFIATHIREASVQNLSFSSSLDMIQGSGDEWLSVDVCVLGGFSGVAGWRGGGRGGRSCVDVSSGAIGASNEELLEPTREIPRDDIRSADGYEGTGNE